MSTSSPERKLGSFSGNGTSPVRHRRGAASLALAASNHGGSLPSLLREMAKLEAVHDEEMTLLAQNLESSSSSVSAYLASLTTQPLASLQSQPELLASSSIKLQDQLSELCTRQVGPLVQVHEATTSLPLSLEHQKSFLNVLTQKALPRLGEVATSFPSKANNTLASRDRAHKLLEAHSTLLSDILDIPALINTCTRGGHYHEALQLGTHIARLAVPGSDLGGGPVLSAIRLQSWKALQDFRTSLLHSLSSRTLTIASASRSIANIRKMRDIDQLSGGQATSSSLGLTEEQLCLAFLRSRASVLQETLASPFAHQRKLRTSQHLKSAHLEGFVNAWRDGIDETCGMVRAIFQQQGSADEAFTSHFVQLFADQLQDELINGLPNLMSPLTSLDPSQSRQQQSIPTATTIAAAAEATASDLRSLFTQLSLTGQTLSRWGVNITPLVLGTGTALHLEQYVLDVLKVPLARARALMQKRIPSHALTLPSTWLVNLNDAPRLVTEHSRRIDPSEIRTLSSFPPLAFSLNDVLIGINATRIFAPFSQRLRCLELLDELLSEIFAMLTNYSLDLPEQASESTLSSGPHFALPILEAESSSERREYATIASSIHRRTQAERVLAARALDHFVEILVPYTRQSLWSEVFGASEPLPGIFFSVEQGVNWSRETKLAWVSGERSRLHEIAEQVKKEEIAEAQRVLLENEEHARVRAEDARRVEEEERQREEERLARQQEAAKRASHDQEQREEEDRRAKEAEERRRREEEAEAERIAKEGEVMRTKEVEETRSETEDQHHSRQEQVESTEDAARILRTSQEIERPAQHTKLTGAEASHTMQGERTDLPTHMPASETASGSTSVVTTTTLDSSDRTQLPSSAQDLPTSDATGVPRKLTLAEKLKAKAEERQRQAAAAAKSPSSSTISSAIPTPSAATPPVNDGPTADSATGPSVESNGTSIAQRSVNAGSTTKPSQEDLACHPPAAAVSQATADGEAAHESKSEAEDERKGDEEDKDDEEGTTADDGGQSAGSAKKRKKKKKRGNR